MWEGLGRQRSHFCWGLGTCGFLLEGNGLELAKSMRSFTDSSATVGCWQQGLKVQSLSWQSLGDFSQILLPRGASGKDSRDQGILPRVLWKIDQYDRDRRYGTVGR